MCLIPAVLKVPLIRTADGGAGLLTVPGAGQDEDDESVCSSLDGSVLSDEGE